MLKKRLEEEEKQGTKKIAVMDTEPSMIHLKKFTCRSCLRLITMNSNEPKYQCIICPGVQVCGGCFKGSFHTQHKFVVLHSSLKGAKWIPAVRDSAMGTDLNQNSELEEEYQRLIDELKGRELTPEDNALLIQL